MKKFLVSALVSNLVLAASAFAAPTMACWDRNDHSSHAPALVATFVNSTEIASLSEGGSEVKGPLLGVINPRARKYAGMIQFSYTVNSAWSVLSIPQNVLHIRGYFQAAEYGSDGEGGGTTFLNCEIR